MAKKKAVANADKPSKMQVMKDVITKMGMDSTWGSAGEAATAALKAAGLTPNEASDKQAFQNAKTALGGGTIKRVKLTKGEKPTIKQFVANLSAGVDSQLLKEAIELINKCGGASNALELSERWEQLVKKLGDKNAREAVELIG